MEIRKVTKVFLFFCFFFDVLSCSCTHYVHILYASIYSMIRFKGKFQYSPISTLADCPVGSILTECTRLHSVRTVRT